MGLSQRGLSGLELRRCFLDLVRTRSGAHRSRDQRGVCDRFVADRVGLAYARGGVCRVRLGLRREHVRLCLCQASLRGRSIQLSQQIAGFDSLILSEQDLRHHAADARGHGHDIAVDLSVVGVFPGRNG